jgi:integrase
VLDDDYVKALSEATRVTRRRQLRQLCSALVLSGFPIAKLTSLSVLLQKENARQALRAQRDQLGKTKAVSLGNKAWLLSTIARQRLRDEVLASELRDMARGLTLNQTHITAKNSTRLRQFDLEGNIRALLLLPAEVFQSAKNSARPKAVVAREVMLALAVELLLVAPMRLRNLASLEIHRHLPVVGRGKQYTRHISIPPEETKTGEAFETLLPSGTAKLLQEYLETYWPLLTEGSSIYLFPNPSGIRRNLISFSDAISRFVERETGLIINPHLFRHLAGKLHLRMNPNDLETVRRILGHRRSETTSRYYTEEQAGRAFRAYDTTIGELRSSSASGSFSMR